MLHAEMWYITPCSLVDINPIFTGNCYFGYHLLMAGAKCHVTEDNGIQFHHLAHNSLPPDHVGV
jgi:hypothetical protein